MSTWHAIFYLLLTLYQKVERNESLEKMNLVSKLLGLILKTKKKWLVKILNFNAILQKFQDI